ncbi:MAG: hypothetical protein GDA38_24715 [Hormoscilla sp. SP12CHS1]|nr:hypothetical protein [Hormoscilla sp. SP12CHS1]
MLVDGDRLDRERSPVNEYHEEEKGLILATNLPVYIQASVGLDGSTYGFNLHQTSSGAIQEEFETPLDDSWSNFYSRNNLDPDFACRNGQPGCTTSGDLWRSATIISDAITLLSDSFEFGYRVDGDYDLRNNAGGAEYGGGNNIMMIDRDGDGTIDETIDPAERGKENGFFANNYVTSRDFQDSDYRSLVTEDEPPGYQASSYFNNFVTPVQRQTLFYEYVMEICRKPMVSLCTADDWVVGLTTGTGNEKASQIPIGTPVGNLLSGTTARPARSLIDPLDPALNVVEQRYPRRVAFLRNPADNRLIVVTTNPGTTTEARRPIPIGIDIGGNLNWYPYQNPGGSGILLPVTGNVLVRGGTPTPFGGLGPGSPGANTPRRQDNALWYVTGQDTNRRYGNTRWLWYQQHDDAGYLLETVPLAQNTTSSPPWRTAISSEVEQPLLEPVLRAGSSDYVDLNISGSFIETKQNNYATAPFFTLLNTTEADAASLFVERQGYKTDNGTSPLGYTGDNVLGAIPYYNAPGREWRFDVGLLSQPPDLFAEQFTVETAESPKEFMREVNRDDRWVEALMCAAEALDPAPSSDDPQTYVGLPGATYDRYAIPGADQRPNDCRPLSDYPDNPS